MKNGLKKFKGMSRICDIYCLAPKIKVKSTIPYQLCYNSRSVVWLPFHAFICVNYFQTKLFVSRSATICCLNIWELKTFQIKSTLLGFLFCLTKKVFTEAV